TKIRAEEANTASVNQAQSLRSFGTGLTEGHFTADTRTVRGTTTGSVEGDLFFETDTTWLYRWTGTVWAWMEGIYVATDTTRASLTISTVDNGALFYTTDTGILWRVEGGAWVNKFVSISVTTSYKVCANQVIGTRKTGWGRPAGTLSRAGYASDAGQTISNTRTHGDVQTVVDAVE